jgi:hypothetical protein
MDAGVCPGAKTYKKHKQRTCCGRGESPDRSTDNLYFDRVITVEVGWNWRWRYLLDLDHGPKLLGWGSKMHPNDDVGVPMSWQTPAVGEPETWRWPMRRLFHHQPPQSDAVLFGARAINNAKNRRDWL